LTKAAVQRIHVGWPNERTALPLPSSARRDAEPSLPEGCRSDFIVHNNASGSDSLSAGFLRSGVNPPQQHDAQGRSTKT
jgi:hypothetical protein